MTSFKDKQRKQRVRKRPAAAMPAANDEMAAGASDAAAVSRPWKKMEQVLRENFHERHRRYQRPAPQEEENIRACYLLTGNMREVVRVTGWSKHVVKRVVDQMEETGFLHDLRIQHQEKAIGLASDGIALSLLTVVDGLKRGYIKGRKLDPETGEEVYFVSRVRPGEAATVALKLMQLIKLHEERRPSIVEELARRMTREELWQEAKSLYAQIKKEMEGDDDPPSGG